MNLATADDLRASSTAPESRTIPIVVTVREVPVLDVEQSVFQAETKPWKTSRDTPD
jgi:hypothetical protein